MTGELKLMFDAHLNEPSQFEIEKLKLEEEEKKKKELFKKISINFI